MSLLQRRPADWWLVLHDRPGQPLGVEAIRDRQLRIRSEQTIAQLQQGLVAFPGSAPRLHAHAGTPVSDELRAVWRV